MILTLLQAKLHSVLAILSAVVLWSFGRSECKKVICLWLKMTRNQTKIHFCELKVAGILSWEEIVQFSFLPPFSMGFNRKEF